MRKYFKIGLITLTSLLMLVLVVASILIWIVFTPARLTPVVRNQVGKYISCKSEIGEVELTFFSTFPEFGLKINNLTLINAVPNSQSDTLIKAKTALAVIDIAALWNDNELIINSVELDDVLVNGFVDEKGVVNYNIFKSDTTQSGEFENPFSKIDLHELTLQNAQISYVNQSNKMYALLQNVNGKLSFDLQNDNLNALLNLNTNSIYYKQDTIEFLKNSKVKCEIPLQYNLKNNLLTLSGAKLNLNDLPATLDGTVELQENGNMLTDIKFSTDDYQFVPFLNMIPDVYTKSLEGIKMDGIFRTRGTVSGIYNDSVMPVIKTTIDLNNGEFEYVELPYQLREMVGNADVNIDLNNKNASNIVIHNLKLKTGNSNIEGSGVVETILSEDMLVDFDLNMSLNLEELLPMFPEDMPVALKGNAVGSGNVRFMLSDAKNKAVSKMNIAGKFDVSNMSFRYDSMMISSDKSKLDIKMPNPVAKKTGFMLATLWSNKLKFNKGNNLTAKLNNSTLIAETTDVMNFERLNTIDCKFKFDQMSARMDDMSANLEKSSGVVQTKMNFSDTVAVPEIRCDYDVSALTAMMDTMTVKMKYPKGNFSMVGDKLNADKVLFNVLLNSNQTTAGMGTQSVYADLFHLNTTIDYFEKESNRMLQWVPTGNVSLQNGKISVDKLNANIEVPSIQFDFTPETYTINDSRFIVDNSDFQLTGKLWNVSNYFKDKGLLQGDFNFVSDKTDVYRLLELTNGFGVEDSIIVTDLSSTTTSETEELSGPYMVPKGMDIKLHANINNVSLGYDDAKNVIGDLFINDGVLVLQDMRFVTPAAKMQLTAMYKTPRKNHIFMGMDFHVLDMEISEMLKMIPDIDTIMPMLRSFDGKGEFHIAVETYMDSMYNLKKSTLKGTSSIKGENLVLMDGETFSEIAKTLRFNKKTKNKVDSLSAEFTIFKNEVDIYPFLIVMDKYKAVIDGRHNLDMNFDYHISVTDSPFPIKFGVDVKGQIGDLKIRPAKCKYANLYRPAQRKELDTKKLEIRKMIRDALMKKVVE